MTDREALACLAREMLIDVLGYRPNVLVLVDADHDMYVVDVTLAGYQVIQLELDASILKAPSLLGRELRDFVEYALAEQWAPLSRDRHEAVRIVNGEYALDRVSRDRRRLS